MKFHSNQNEANLINLHSNDVTRNVFCYNKHENNNNIRSSVWNILQFEIRYDIWYENKNNSGVGFKKHPILCLQIIIDGAQFYIESDEIAKWNKLILKKFIKDFQYWYWCATGNSLLKLGSTTLKYVNLSTMLTRSNIQNHMFACCLFPFEWMHTSD